MCANGNAGILTPSLEKTIQNEKLAYESPRTPPWVCPAVGVQLRENHDEASRIWSRAGVRDRLLGPLRTLIMEPQDPYAHLGQGEIAARRKEWREDNHG